GGDEGRRNPREHRALQRRDRHPRAEAARLGDAGGARVGRRVHARRRAPPVPHRRRPAREPVRRGGTSCAGDGHVVREPGVVGRVRDPARGRARAEGLSGAGGDRRGDRALEARDDGCRDRPADGGAGEVPSLVGRRHLTAFATVCCQRMKALILAAGYATRLRPLTESIPKQLLPVGGRPMVDWIVDKIRETDADEIHLVTNHRFADDFRRWAPDDVVVHDDGTTSNDDRLGAIGDIQFVGLDDDLLAIAGDNLFDYSLRDYLGFWRTKGGSCVAVHDVGDRELAKKYGIVDVDTDDRVTNFVEKPA